MARPLIGEGKKQQPECPTCGDAFGRYNEKVWANGGSLPVRTYSCPTEGCPTFMTVEIPIPPGRTTKHALDEGYRAYRAAYHRQKYGYQPSATRGNPYLDSDIIVPIIKIKKAPRRRADPA